MTVLAQAVMYSKSVIFVSILSAALLDHNHFAGCFEAHKDENWIRAESKPFDLNLKPANSSHHTFNEFPLYTPSLRDIEPVSFPYNWTKRQKRRKSTSLEASSQDVTKTEANLNEYNFSFGSPQAKEKGTSSLFTKLHSSADQKLFENSPMLTQLDLRSHAGREMTHKSALFPCNVTLEILHLQDLTSTYLDSAQQMADRLTQLYDPVLKLYPESRFGIAAFRDKPISGLGDPDDYCISVVLELGSQAISSRPFNSYDLMAGGGGDWLDNQIGAILRAALGGVFSPKNQTSTGGRPLLRSVILSTHSLPHLAPDAATHIVELNELVIARLTETGNLQNLQTSQITIQKKEQIKHKIQELEEKKLQSAAESSSNVIEMIRVNEIGIRHLPFQFEKLNESFPDTKKLNTGCTAVEYPTMQNLKDALEQLGIVLIILVEPSYVTTPSGLKKQPKEFLDLVGNNSELLDLNLGLTRAYQRLFQSSGIRAFIEHVEKDVDRMRNTIYYAINALTDATCRTNPLPRLPPLPSVKSAVIKNGTSTMHSIREKRGPLLIESYNDLPHHRGSDDVVANDSQNEKEAKNVRDDNEVINTTETAAYTTEVPSSRSSLSGYVSSTVPVTAVLTPSRPDNVLTTTTTTMTATALSNVSKTASPLCMVAVGGASALIASFVFTAGLRLKGKTSSFCTKKTFSSEGISSSSSPHIEAPRSSVVVARNALIESISPGYYA